MSIVSELIEKIRNYVNINDNEIITDTTPCNGISEMKLRDYLMEIGTILEYDENANIFIATIKAGFGDRNPAIVGMMLHDKTFYIAAYAKEGFIHQETAQKAIQKVFHLFA